MENPSASMKARVPTRDSGMATVGMIDERIEPRNRNTTTVTIAKASARLRITSLMALCTNSVKIDDLAIEAMRQQRLDAREDVVDALDNVKQVGRRRNLDADIDRLLAIETDFGFVILGAERNVGDILEPHDSAAALPNDDINRFQNHDDRPLKNFVLEGLISQRPGFGR